MLQIISMTERQNIKPNIKSIKILNHNGKSCIFYEGLGYQYIFKIQLIRDFSCWFIGIYKRKLFESKYQQNCCINYKSEDIMEKQDKKQPQVIVSNKHHIDIENNQQISLFFSSHSRTKKVNGIRVPTPQTNHYHKQLKKTRTFLDIPNLEKIFDSPPDSKIILVEKDFTIEQIQLFKNKIGQLEPANIQKVEQQVIINYKNMSTQQLFDLFVEGRIPFPNSFETVGHLAHYNLTTEQIPYHKVIGEITLLKCPNITCVVNKTEKLHNIYRTPTLQMMAGVKDFTVKLKQVGTAFEFDFEKVYWCSRLQQERDRLLIKMNKGQCLADIFCGCGPLAVRAGRKGLFVIANDLNPYGHEYLVHNCKLNKIEAQMMCWNMCARQAMLKIYKQKQSFQKQFQKPDHIYMNLPVDAIQFLDVFTNYSDDMKTQKMPLVHVNCFVVADTDEKSKHLLAQRIGKTLPGFKEGDILEMNHIKNVTIIMRMYCVTFRLRKWYKQNDKQQMEQQVKQNDKQQMEQQVKQNKQADEIQTNKTGQKKVKPNQPE